MEFHKYHAYGNAYTVLQENQFPRPLTPPKIGQLCHSEVGIGGDGLLIATHSPDAPHRFFVRILNPDGSEAEKSGNGLSIFAAYLFEHHHAQTAPFYLQTSGGEAQVQAISSPRPSVTAVSLQVGQVKVEPQPLTLSILDRTFTAYQANIGNPHCVIFADLTPAQVSQYGPHIETHAHFPNLTNVQFVQIKDRENIAMQIWERGAGYTAASGSSASAVATVCHELGHTAPQVTLHMPGGTLPVLIDKQNNVTIHNRVHKIAQGTLVF